MFTTILASIGLIIGLGGLTMGGYALWRIRRVQGEYRTLTRRALTAGSGASDPHAVRDVAVLHYDALDGMSGARSFSLALLNGHGDGVVVTSINGRTESRTYAKALVHGEAETTLSPEEYRVVRTARLGDGIGISSPASGQTSSDGAPSKTDVSEREGTKEEKEALVTVLPGPQPRQNAGAVEQEEATAEARPPGPRDQQ